MRTGPVLLLMVLPAVADHVLAGRLERVPAGDWGGPHVALSVHAAGAGVELDCAHGTIDAVMKLDRKGRFEVKGRYVREPGGPIRLDVRRAQWSVSPAGSRRMHSGAARSRDAERGTERAASGDVEQSQPARYTGSTDGHTLTLSIALEGGQTVGPLKLSLGGRPRLMKCR